MTYHFQNPSDGVIKQYLKNSKVIAVVGLSDREEATSHRVSKEMQERGYRIIPINPRADDIVMDRCIKQEHTRLIFGE